MAYPHGAVGRALKVPEVIVSDRDNGG